MNSVITWHWILCVHVLDVALHLVETLKPYYNFYNLVLAFLHALVYQELKSGSHLALVTSGRPCARICTVLILAPLGILSSSSHLVFPATFCLLS